jgi:chondroitin AC lyase
MNWQSKHGERRYARLHVGRKALCAAFFACVTIVQSLSATARADDFATLRARFLENLTGGPSLNVDPLIQADREAIVKSAAGMLDPANAAGLNADGSFKGLRYDDASDANVRPKGLHSHFLRVLTLARAYQIPGLALYHSAELRDAIERAIRFGIASSRYCGDASCVKGNWWEWRIGVPGNASYTMLLMDGELPDTLLSQLADHVEYHLRPVSDLESPVVTGQNLMWLAQIQLRVAIFRRATDRAEPIKAGIAKTCVIVREPQGDGIRPDRSFQQHHGVLTIAGYGASYASDIANYNRYTAGTGFSLSEECVRNVVDYVLEGVAFTTFKGVFDPSVRGRDVNHKTPGLASADPFVQLAVASPYRKQELEAVAKAMMADGLIPSGALAAFTREVEASATDAAWPMGHRHFFDADLTVHRRDDYYLSIKMFSTRTLSGEFANGEGRINARQSDGRMVLVRNGKEFNGASGEGLWPAFDWTRMPGTTVEQTGHAASDKYGLSTEAFVGGTDDGQNGVSAMQLRALDSTLRAKKSWFFFDDFVVFLNSDITSDSDFPVETIVTEWPLASAMTTLQVDDGSILALPAAQKVEGARWFSSDGIGYYFPEPTDVRVELKTREGNWNTLGPNSGTVSAAFLSLVVEHGARVQGGTVDYAVALRGQDMSSWSQAAPFTILRNDAELASVDGPNGAGAVFWQPGAVALLDTGTLVASNTPAVVWLSKDGANLTVSVADPVQSEGVLTLTVAGTFLSAEALDPGVQVSVTPSGAVLTVERSGGLTHRARLTMPAEEPSDAGSGNADGPDAEDGDGMVEPDAGQRPDGPHQDGGVRAVNEAQPVGAGCSCSSHAAGRPLRLLGSASLVLLMVLRRLSRKRSCQSA